MRYLIDGHNWFFASTSFKQELFRKAHQRFLEKIKGLLSELKGESVVVFDGGPENDQLIHIQFEQIKIIYTESRQSADEHLLEILSFRRTTPSTLVSSDGDLIHAARKLGAKICHPDDFETWILSKKRKKEKKKPLTCDPLSQEYYINVFTKRLQKMRESDLDQG
ncbi:NYN domain-containing protein [Candidatus Similichlamydia laticola]|uniref:YacP-like NYN domain protein n=1 Tax=Candidatus Similichlamydia laticola TaxID=2170265 RepID=A0A369KC41_9BACT|nr:NYN domain-containing protein [Candidatus Similichlamydia laticola]RDB31162.1 hypothetical protein HAT2_00736 [Candidatus Similichlamydia laticola]